MKVLLLLIGLVACLIVPSQQQRNRRSVLAEIPGLGKLRGRIIGSKWTAQQIYQFYDIKYAESPNGERRFKAPEPAKPWEGIRNAMKPRKGCPALQEMSSIKKTEGNRDVEDCLTLTVSTKDFDRSSPVMVYIHGEFLYEGTSLEASPEYLLERDIVLVAIRYRLAPFGFLSSMSEKIPGNAAVFDVIEALKWINNYIHEFGGDPKRVTLFGQVGGAALAHVLTMSPIVPEDLFHRVIYQSGSALTPTFTTENPVQFTQDIAKHAGCSDVENIDMMDECLIKMNASTLLQGFSKHGLANAQKGIGKYGGVQFTIGGPSGVLPEHPAKLIRGEKIRYYPTLGGVTKNAGTFLLKEIFEDDFDQKIPDDKYNASGYIDYMISHTNGGDPSGAWRKFAERDFFTEEQMKNGTFGTMIPGFIDMCGTIPFKNPILLALQANAKKMPNNTFLYSFDYEGEFNRYVTDDEYENPHIPFEMGVSLTDENLYLFPWPGYASLLNRRDTKIARRMVALWTNFAAKGFPKGPGVQYWPPMSESTGPYLKLNTNVTVGQSFLDEYSITVNESKKGMSLVLEEFFDSENGDEDDKNGEVEEEYEDYDDDYQKRFIVEKS